jgi:UDP:flavonoid glycosyltransferase YjiC (YdhE family)
VSSRPLRLDLLMRACDLAISQAGELSTSVLMLGVPSLLLPGHYEQYLTARRLEQLGSAAWLGVRARPGDVAHAMGLVLGNPRFADAARRYAKRYPGFSPAEQRRRIVARIEQIATHGSALPRDKSPPILAASRGEGGTP